MLPKFKRFIDILSHSIHRFSIGLELRLAWVLDSKQIKRQIEREEEKGEKQS